MTACGASAPLVTVDQLVARCDALKGKPVRLAGYLGTCAGYDCHVYPDKAGEQAMSGYLRHPEKGATRPNWVGIGGGQEFDRKAASFQNSYVVIWGEVAADDCTGDGGTDRSTGVEPTEIRAWTPVEGAPANT